MLLLPVRWHLQEASPKVACMGSLLTGSLCAFVLICLGRGSIDDPGRSGVGAPLEKKWFWSFFRTIIMWSR